MRSWRAIARRVRCVRWDETAGPHLPATGAPAYDAGVHREIGRQRARREDGVVVERDPTVVAAAAPEAVAGAFRRDAERFALAIAPARRHARARRRGASPRARSLPRSSPSRLAITTARRDRDDDHDDEDLDRA